MALQRNVVQVNFHSTAENALLPGREKRLELHWPSSFDHPNSLVETGTEEKKTNSKLTNKDFCSD